jgi:hypothetical protein
LVAAVRQQLLRWRWHAAAAAADGIYCWLTVLLLCWGSDGLLGP